MPGLLGISFGIDFINMPAPSRRISGRWDEWSFQSSTSIAGETNQCNATFDNIP